MSRPSTTGRGAGSVWKRLDEVAQGHLDTLRVGELEADAVLAGDGSDDAHLLRQREREVVGERGDL
jgi:hypothetical protein